VVSTTVSYQAAMEYIQRIPEILGRKDSKSQFVQAVFWGTVVREMFRKMHRSYDLRSKGGADELGKWRKLKPRTVAIKKRLGYKSTADLINVRTKSLLNSYRPGRVSNGYIPANAHQLVEMTRWRVTLGTKHKHADAVNKLRTIFPDVPTRWVVEAIESGLRAVVPLLGSLR